MTEERIGKIKSTMLGWEDHGIFTFFLDLDYGGSQQGAGGYGLDEPIQINGSHYTRQGTVYGLEFIMRVLQAAGVRKWEELPGRTLYAIIEDGLVRGLKPLPTEGGKAFMFDEIRHMVEA